MKKNLSLALLAVLCMASCDQSMNRGQGMQPMQGGKTMDRGCNDQSCPDSCGCSKSCSCK